MRGVANKNLANILIALLMSATWALFSTTLTLDNGDFPGFYTAAVLARQGDFEHLHDEQRQAQIQVPLVPHRTLIPVYFMRAEVYAALLAGFALLPIQASFVVWIVWQAAMLMACWWWVYRRFGSDALALASLFPPAIMGFAFGQDPVVFLSLAILSFCLYERGRPLASGLVLGLIFIKPHLILLIPFALAIQKRWRMFFGVVISGAAETIVSISLGGWRNIGRYLQFLSRQHQVSPTPWRMLNVYAIGTNLGIGGKVFNCAMVLLVIACVAAICYRREWWSGMSAAMIGTFLIAPHAYLYDSTMLVLPALLIAFQARTVFARGAAVAVLTPIASLLQVADMPWTAAAAMLLLISLISLAAEATGVFRRTVLAPAPQTA